MNSRERFLISLRNGKPDRVPLMDWLFSQRLFKEILGIVPDGLHGDLAVRCGRAIGHDAVWLPFGGYAGTSNTKGVYQDEWGTTYQKDLAVSWPIDAPIDYPIKSPADLAAFSAPNPRKAGRLDDLRKGIREAKGEIAILGGITGPFTTAWMLLGYERLCQWIYEYPGLVRRIFGIAVEYYREAANQMMDLGVDAVMVAEDLGYSRGLFWSPGLYQEHLFPFLKELIGRIRSRDMPVVLHCDGNINEILEDLVSMDIQALNPIERKACMDIENVKRVWGKRIALIGNLDLVHILPNGTPGEVATHVKDLIETVGKNGGYIVASEHSLNQNIPLENILAIRDAVQEFGFY